VGGRNTHPEVKRIKEVTNFHLAGGNVDYMEVIVKRSRESNRGRSWHPLRRRKRAAREKRVDEEGRNTNSNVKTILTR